MVKPTKSDIQFLLLKRPTKLMVLWLMLFAAACSPKVTVNTTPVRPPESFSVEGSQQMPERWWEVFQSDELNALVDTALQSNFNIKTAWERLKAAEAVLRREKSTFFPAIGAYVSAEKNRSQSQFRDNEQLQLGLDANYEVDLWGRIKSGVQAEQYRMNASYTDFQTAALSVSAEIVRNWFQLIEAENQLDLTSTQVETNEKVLRLVKARFGYGQIRGVDILRQQQLLEASRTQKIAAETRVELLKHRLAVLSGKPPRTEFSFANDTFPDFPEVPQTGLPTDLVQRRPDVQSAFNLLQAADYDLAVAIRNRYPRLNLSATISTAAINADKLFEDWAYSVAGNLLAPVFYGRELQAEADRAEAVRSQRLYEYGQAVLIAFREVEDALIQEQKQLETIASLKEQARLSEQTYKQLQSEYFHGMSNYLDVLTALDSHQELQRELLSANLMLFEYRVALYRALAGSFDTNYEELSEAENLNSNNN